MLKILNDPLALDILELITTGKGISVNIFALSKSLGKHRNTIKAQVDALFKHSIINKPVYPFIWLYQDYPLMVISKTDLPRTEKIDRFLKEDEHIFGAFYRRDEVYNTLLIEFHKDLFSYGEWRKNIVVGNKIPPREIRYPSDTLFFSVKKFVKYQPYSPIYVMERKLKDGKDLIINNYKMNKLGFQILKNLMMEHGIRTNISFLSKQLNVHRKPIEHRIETLLKEKIISRPTCRFPKFFVPPNQILVYCQMEIMGSWDKIIKAILLDPYVPLAIQANIGRYNLLLFKVFPSVEEEFKWEQRYDERFPNSIGAMKKLFLLPEMTASLDQQKVSLSIIKQRKKLLHGRKLIEALSGGA